MVAASYIDGLMVGPPGPAGPQGAPGTAADLAGQDVSTGPLTVVGTITQGPSIEVVGTATTVGASTAVFFAVPLAANTSASTTYRMSCNDGASSAAVFGSGDADAYSTLGGSGHPIGSPVVNSGFPIPPSLSVAWDPDTNTLTFTANGPSAIITGCASNGDMPTPHVRVTTSTSLNGALNLMSVTISGVLGTTEANGAHVVTLIDSNHFDILTVPFVNAYTSGGTAVLTTPQTTRWAGWGRFVAV